MPTHLCNEALFMALVHPYYAMTIAVITFAWFQGRCVCVWIAGCVIAEGCATSHPGCG